MFTGSIKGKSLEKEGREGYESIHQIKANIASSTRDSIQSF